MNLSYVAKYAFDEQMGPSRQIAMPFGSRPHQGLKNCGLSQKIFFDFFLRDPWGALRGLYAAGHIS